MRAELLAVIGDDAGGFLAAVLQGVQPERGQGRRVGMAINPENAAFLVEVVIAAAGRRHPLPQSGRSSHDKYMTPGCLLRGHEPRQAALSPVDGSINAVAGEKFLGLLRPTLPKGCESRRHPRTGLRDT